MMYILPILIASILIIKDLYHLFKSFLTSAIYSGIPGFRLRFDKRLFAKHIFHLI